jgi:hypothetical protein
MPFENEVKDRIQANSQDNDLCNGAVQFVRASTAPKYSYNFS